MARKDEDPRTPTRDLSLGLGLFRWGDGKAAVKKHVPRAEWTVYEPMYAFEHVFYVREFLELMPGLVLDASIDPGAKGGGQVVSVEVFPEAFEGRAAEVWRAVTALCADLGKPGLELPTADVVTWDCAGASVELTTTRDGAHLWISRPKD